MPGVMDVCHKDTLGKILNIWSDVFPEEYDFIPRTFICPAELSKAEAYMERKKGKRRPFYIVKPSTGCQGDGLYLIQSIDEIQEKTSRDEFIIQEYITDPFLIDGKKFDLRLYVTAFGIEPMTAYMY